MKDRIFPSLGYNPVTGEWNDSLAGDYLWSNVNVSEAVPDVMTPSTWSLWWIFHYEINPFQFPGDHPMCGNICGRPYLNLSLMYSVYRAIGLDARKQLQGDMIASVPLGLEIPSIPFSRLQVYRIMLPGVIRGRAQAVRDQASMASFLRTMPGWCRATRQAIHATSDPAALLLLWRDNVRPAILRSCRMLRSATMASAEPATNLHLELVGLVGESDANLLMAKVSSSSGALESLGPLIGLAGLRAGQLTRADYLERYGHRGPHEMELSAPGLDEDPEGFGAAWAASTSPAPDVGALLARQQTEHASAWQRFQSSHPARVKATSRLLDAVARAAREREAVRSEVTRAARVVRSFLLRAGELTGLGEQVFFLSLDEAAALLAGDKSSSMRIPARQEAYARAAALPPFPPVIIGRFDPARWASDPDRRSDYFDARGSQPPVSQLVKGVAGSAGCVEGSVRRLDRFEDASQVLPGEILVTVTTNIGWTPIFPRLAAIITDVGAPLSHAAIVAREVGIPAVVGCGNATALLRTGMRVRVDGAQGTVEILAQPEVVA